MPTPARRAPTSVKDGVVDVNQWNKENAKWPLSLLQPPTVYKDFVFVGWAGKDWADAEAPPGTIFALDARTGALRWTFHSIPKEIAAKTGTANVWASMAVDPERDILYIPVSARSPNFFGGNRLDPIPLGTSVTALRRRDRRSRRRSRQLVHHDIWDFDTNSAPTLVDITRDGKKIPALVQTSKQGFLYVLESRDGRTGLSDRGLSGAEVDGAGRGRVADAALRGKPEGGHFRHLARGLIGSPISRASATAHARQGN